jgi:hypothetical protein
VVLLNGPKSNNGNQMYVLDSGDESVEGGDGDEGNEGEKGDEGVCDCVCDSDDIYSPIRTLKYLQYFKEKEAGKFLSEFCDCYLESVEINGVKGGFIKYAAIAAKPI